MWIAVILWPNNNFLFAVWRFWKPQRFPVPRQVQRQILYLQRRHTGHRGSSRGWNSRVEEDNQKENVRQQICLSGRRWGAYLKLWVPNHGLLASRERTDSNKLFRSCIDPLIVIYRPPSESPISVWKPWRPMAARKKRPVTTYGWWTSTVFWRRVELRVISTATKYGTPKITKPWGLSSRLSER